MFIFIPRPLVNHDVLTFYITQYHLIFLQKNESFEEKLLMQKPVVFEETWISKPSSICQGLKNDWKEQEVCNGNDGQRVGRIRVRHFSG